MTSMWELSEVAAVGFHAQALCSEGFYPGSRIGKQQACCADQSHWASPFLLLLAVRALVIRSQMSSWPRAPGAGWGDLTWSLGAHGVGWVEGQGRLEGPHQLDLGPGVAAAPQPGGRCWAVPVHVIPSLWGLSLTRPHCADELSLGTRAHN